jgi:4-hydroxybutyrate CoA-transferase
VDWRKKYASKLMSAPDAVADIQSGQWLAVGMFDGVPVGVCNALTARAADLDEVKVFHFVSAYPWFSFNEGKSFRVYTPFTTNVDREQVKTGLVEYIPAAIWRSGRLPHGIGPFDYHLCVTSPPDDEGWCSFGGTVWMNPTFADHSKTIIAEIDETAIRTGGANRIHVDRIDRMVEQDPKIRDTIKNAMARAAVRKDEEVAQAEVICTLIAMELVRDGDTVQIGAGAISASLGPYLSHRKELGIHTELMAGGVAELVRQGVVTGQHKATHTGKVVATGIALVTPEELAFIDGNDTFELYDFTYTDDIDYMGKEPRLIAVNNAMEVDLTGQANSEAIGPWPFTGPGGQTAFVIAAAHSADGKSIIVCPSSFEKDGKRESRIVASLDPGSPVTAPRSAVDYVVTEYGIATLRGKTIRQRIGELIAVAHPDCQPQIKEDAQRLYGWSF